MEATPEEKEQIMRELREEAEAFQRDHGIFSQENRIAGLLENMPERVINYYVEAREDLMPLEGVVSTLSCIKRLHSLNQLNGKVNPEEVPENPRHPYIITPSFHTRHDHSELLAEQSVLAGVVLGLGLRELSLLYCGGMFHDVGHSAFGHAGDEQLIRNGRPGHEERGWKILQTEEVSLQMQAMGLDVKDIFDVIKEKGSLGILQKTFDTLSYLVLDSGMMLRPMYKDFGAEVILSIADVEDDTFVVYDIDPLQLMLDNRAKMSQWIYYGNPGKMTDESIRKMLSISFNRGLITPKELETAGDDHMRMKIQSMVQRDPGASIFGGRYDKNGKPYTDTPLKDCKDLFSMMRGFFNKETWTRYSYEPDEQSKIDEFFFRHRNNKKIVEQAFVVKPFDYTKKTLKVKTVDGRTHTLKCKDIELRPEDKQHILYSPKT
jgi:hypothetical protein